MGCGTWSQEARRTIALAVELAVRAYATYVEISHVADALRESPEFDGVLTSHGLGPRPRDTAAIREHNPLWRRNPPPRFSSELAALLRHAERLASPGTAGGPHILRALLVRGGDAAAPFVAAGIDDATLDQCIVATCETGARRPR